MLGHITKRKGFCEKEYRNGAYLSLSDKPIEALEKFIPLYYREHDKLV